MPTTSALPRAVLSSHQGKHTSFPRMDTPQGSGGISCSGMEGREGGDTWDEDGLPVAVVVAAGVNQVVAGVLGEVVGCGLCVFTMKLFTVNSE